MDHHKILIVEDESVVAMEIEARLTELGYKVVGAVTSGTKALNLLEEVKPDIILLDIMLEGDLDGIETGKIIKERYGLPFIFLTAYSDDDTLRRAMETGPYSYLRKPFEEFELVSALQISISKSRLENKLTERENILSATLSSISDTVISIDNKFKVLFMNARGEKLTGLNQNEVIGKYLSDIIGVKVFQNINEISDNGSDNILILNNNAFHMNECSIKDYYGNEKIIEYSSVPLSNAYRDKSGFVISIKDITDKKSVENKIVEFEKKISTLSEYTGVALYNYHGINKTYDYLSHVIENITGYSQEEFSKINFSDIIEKYDILKPPNTKSPTDLIENWYNGKLKEYQADALIVRKDGTKIWINDKSSPWYDKDGKVIGSIGMIQDINDKKIAESKLIQSEREYRGLFENAHDAIIIFKPENEKILEINKRACELYGFPKEELVGKSLRDFSKDPERGHKQVENTLKIGINHNFETSQYNRAGEEIIFEVNAAVVVYKGEQAILSINHDISERKRTETKLREYQNKLEELVSKRTQALKESEIQFRTLAQNIDDVILRIDKNLHILYANPAVKKISEKEFHQLTGENLSNIGLGIELESNFKNIVEAVFVTESKSRFEIKLENDTWFDCNIVPEFSNEGKVKSVLISAREISDLKNAEEMIRRRDNLLQAISNSSMLLISENSIDKALNNTIEHIGRSSGLDRIYIFQNDYNDKKFISISQKYEWTSKGISPELFDSKWQNFDLVNSGFENWYHELKEGSAVYGSSKIFTEKQSEVLSARNVESLALIPIFKDELFWGVIGFDDCTHQKSWSIGEIAALFTLAGNIGSAISRWEIEKEIKLSNDRWKNLFEFAPEAFYLLQLDGTIVDCNNAAENLINTSKNELLDCKIFQTKLVPLNDLNEFWNAINECKKGNQSYIGEIRIDFSSEESKIIELRSYPIKLMNEDLILISAHDISLRIKAENEIKKTLNKAIELNELKSRFVSMVSHEFRTPLSTILSSIELIELIGVSISEKERSDHYRKIINSIDYMTEMLNDVITINRADSGKLVAKRKEVELVEFTLQIIDDLIISTGDDVDINYNVNAETFKTLVDEKLYRQILTNLLSNSIKYTPYGKPIDCMLEIHDYYYEIKVIDQGIGIPESELQEIFSPFHRASNIRNEPGTGLGLAITKRSVETLGGSINVSSQIDEGTTFIVKLPIVKELT